MSELTLKVIREPYIACGDCMFISPSLFEINKHGITDRIYCNLFNHSLVASDNDIEKGFTVEPCMQCSELGNE